MGCHYTVTVERDPETNWLVGEVKELPGCYTEAPDFETLEKSIREAIEVYLETQADTTGQPPIFDTEFQQAA